MSLVRSVLARGLHGLGWLWLLGAAVIIVVTWIGFFMRARNVWEGIAMWQESVSPTNFGNLLMLLVLIGPGVFLHWLAGRVRGA